MLQRAARVLESENRRLIEQNLELKNRLREAEGKAPQQLELQVKELERQLANRNRMLFGPSTERRPKEHPAPDKTKQQGHGPRKQPELPELEKHYHLEPADQTCPSCGGQLEEWAGQFEDSEEIDVLARRFVRLKHRRQKYRCQCGGCIETAEGPPKLIKGGRYSIHFAAQVAIDKYLDHAPLERQVRKMKREGLGIDSQTLWDQVHALATRLEPAHQRLHDYVRNQPVVGADETHWKMMGGRGKKGSKRWQVWALCCPDAVFYRIADSRGADAAQALLAGYSGTVLCDGYAVYESLRKRGESYRIAHCWAHARRKFVEAEPHFPEPCMQVLSLIGELYELERELSTGPPEDRLAVRKQRAGPIVKRIHQWALDVRALPESSLGKAIKYLGAMWNGLLVFLDDPEVSLDNNAVERSLRGVVLGRKNHYGSRSERGTKVAAILYSLLESAKLCQVHPEDYIREATLAAIAGQTIPLPHELRSNP